MPWWAMQNIFVYFLAVIAFGQSEKIFATRMKQMRHCYLAVLLPSAMFALYSPVVRAQDASGGYVSRKEYEELKAEMLAMKKELDTLKKEREVAPRQKDRESQSVADTAPKRETAKAQAIADVHKHVAPEVTLPAVQPGGLLGTNQILTCGLG